MGDAVPQVPRQLGLERRDGSSDGGSCVLADVTATSPAQRSWLEIAPSHRFPSEKAVSGEKAACRTLAQPRLCQV